MATQWTKQTGQTKQPGQTMPRANSKAGVSIALATARMPSKRWLNVVIASVVAVALGAVAGCDNGDNKNESQEVNPSTAIMSEPVLDVPAAITSDPAKNPTTDAAADSGSSSSQDSHSPNNADANPAIKETAVAATAEAEVPPAALLATAGKDLYDKQCHLCHDDGLLEAPKLGDKEAWAPRIAKGINILHQHSAQGYEKMPAQVTNEVTAAQVYAAVDYIIAQSS